jgi:hypothetical protein
MYGYRIIDQRVEHGIHKERYEGNVIEVPVGEKYVAYLPQLIQREIARTGTAVDKNIAINKQ